MSSEHFNRETLVGFGRPEAIRGMRARALAHADPHLAAAALRGLELATGNTRHFRRAPDLRSSPVLAESRGVR